MVYKWFASQESQHFHRVLNGACEKNGKRQHVIDIGANVGYFTLFAAAHGCNVVAVEPQPYAAELIRQSIKANNFPGKVEVVQKVISRDRIRFNYHFPARKTWGWASFFQQADGPIHSTSLDTLAEAKAGNSLLLLKVDTEGMEVTVMDSATRLLALKGAQHMLLEIKSPSLKPKQELLKKLLAFGYTLDGYRENYKIPNGKDVPLYPLCKWHKEGGGFFGGASRVVEERNTPKEWKGGEDFYLRLKHAPARTRG